MIVKLMLRLIAHKPSELLNHTDTNNLNYKFNNNDISYLIINTIIILLLVIIIIMLSYDYDTDRFRWHIDIHIE